MSLSGTIGFAFSILTRLPGHKRLIRKFAQRFFAGELFRDAFKKTLELQKLGFGSILNNVGDENKSQDEVWAAVGIQQGMLRQISRFGLRADVSWKLSRICLSIPSRINHFLIHEEFAELIALLELAKTLNVMVWWDAEELETRSPMWQLGKYLLGKETDFLGIALQAYGAGRYDSQEFLENVIFPFVRGLPPEKVLALRLCKGAYQKSEEKDDIIRDPVTLHTRYIEIAEKLLIYIVESLSQGSSPRLFIEFATQDLELIWIIQAFVKRLSSEYHLRLEVLKRHFRFAMLLGRQEAEASHLITEEWDTYIYVPFGLEQVPYILRRIEEKPECALWGLKKEGEYHRCENPEQCRS